jgi:hypothetical protein
MRITKKKALGVAIMTVVVAGGGTAAYAYFTGTGTGAGTGTVGTAGTFTATVTNAGTPALAPNGVAQPFTYTVTNNGTGQQTYTSVTAGMNLGTDGVSIISGGTTITGCLAAWFTVTTLTLPSATTLAAGATSGNGTGSITMPINTTANQDSCQGKVPAFTLTVS